MAEVRQQPSTSTALPPESPNRVRTPIGSSRSLGIPALAQVLFERAPTAADADNAKPPSSGSIQTRDGGRSEESQRQPIRCNNVDSKATSIPLPFLQPDIIETASADINPNPNTLPEPRSERGSVIVVALPLPELKLDTLCHSLLVCVDVMIGT